MADEPLLTEQLLARAGEGDAAALDALYGRYLPRLQRWAAGRLPAGARDLADTHDLVQDTLLQTLKQLHTFEHRGEGAFLAYLRRAVLNRIFNEVRRVRRKPVPRQIDEAADRADGSASPLEQVLGREALARYERCLQRLNESDRGAIMARLELGCGYEELTQILGKPTEAAARKTVERALRRLAALMRDEH